MLSLIKIGESIRVSSPCCSKWKIEVSLRILALSLHGSISVKADLDEARMRRVYCSDSFGIGYGNFIRGDSNNGT